MPRPIEARETEGGEMMTFRNWKRTGTVLAAVWLLGVGPAAADQWNDRTEMTFSEAVRVPGATLAPGTYIFELAEPDSAPHVIRIRSEKTSDVVATLQAVPVKRAEARAETVLRFNPTEKGAPVAIEAWFYPNSSYGHQFVYSDEEAKTIADRTKSIVLTMEKTDEGRSGELMIYDASGVKKTYAADQATTREWQKWRASQKARAPLVRGDVADGMKVTVDQLEDDASRFIGKAVSVDAEVEEVYGPRLFTIDEPTWGDLEGEIFVYMPTAHAVSVDEDDRVTVSGTVRQFVLGDVDREWGWIDLDPAVRVRLERRPIVIATRIVGGNDDAAFVIERGTAARVPPARSGELVTSIELIDEDEDELIGRRVQLSGVQVTGAEDGGFYAKQGDESVFVLTSEGSKAIESGKTVSIEGYVLRTPRSMDFDRDTSSDEVYVFATRVS
jgi:hypothetical protein